MLCCDALFVSFVTKRPSSNYKSVKRAFSSDISGTDSIRLQRQKCTARSLKRRNILTFSPLFPCRERDELEPVLLSGGSNAHAQLLQQRKQRGQRPAPTSSTTTAAATTAPRHVEQLPGVQPHVPGTRARTRRISAARRTDGDGGSSSPPGRVGLAGFGAATRRSAAQDAVTIRHVRLPYAPWRRPGSTTMGDQR